MMMTVMMIIITTIIINHDCGLSQECNAGLTFKTQCNSSHSQNKSENYMIISTDVVKVSNNILYPFIFIKFLNKLAIKKDSLNLIRGNYKESITKVNDEIVNSFCLILGLRKGYPLLSFLSNYTGNPS